VLVALAAFLLKTAIALSTYGSTDARIFEADLAKVGQDGGVALYRDGIRTSVCVDRIRGAHLDQGRQM
jgi:hypothetical protein